MLEQYGDGILVLLGLAPLAVFSWLWLFRYVLRKLGVTEENALEDITLPEAVLYAGIGFSSAYLVGAVFSRFV